MSYSRIGDVHQATTAAELCSSVGVLEARVQYALVSGTSDKGDGGAKVYYWDPASGATADGVTVLVTAANTTGRFYEMSGGSSGTAAPHHLTHERGAADQITGELLQIALVPTSYTRTLGAGTSATLVDQLGAHLNGIQAALAAKATTTHATTHISGATDPIDGDQLDITITSGNVPGYTATATGTGSVATTTSHLSAHLKGISNALVAKASTTHATAHVPAGLGGTGTDIIDGDRLEISITTGSGGTLTGYTASTSGITGTVNATTNLSAHLKGISDALISIAVGGGAHASTHVDGGADEIDGERLAIGTFTSPANYTRSTTSTSSTAVGQVGAHFKGIDVKLGTIDTAISGKASTTHAATHVPSGLGGVGGDVIDGDRLDMSITAGPGQALTGYTPSTSGITGIVNSTTSLTAHLKGISDALLSIAVGGGAHASTHYDGGADEVDGERLAIGTFTPSAYTRSTTGTTSTAVGQIGANFKGIDTLLGTHTSAIAGKASTDHDLTHVDGGSDEIDGERLAVNTFTPTNYTRNTTGTTSTATGQVGANFKGIDTKLGTIDTAISGKASSTHASTHISAGADEVDGDKLDIDFASPNITNYTPTATGTGSTATTTAHLSAHLKGIDNALGTRATSTHASTHISSGSDEIDGDRIDIDLVSPYILYTPYAAGTNGVATTSSHLSAHLRGLDEALRGKSAITHTVNHISGGTEEIDGDKIDIDLTGTSYTPTATGTGGVATTTAHLSAHLKGISNSLASLASGAAHASTHISGGSDVIDGDRIDIDIAPYVSYTPTSSTTGGIVSSTSHLSAHLKGISNYINTFVSRSGDVMDADAQLDFTGGDIFNLDSVKLIPGANIAQSPDNTVVAASSHGLLHMIPSASAALASGVVMLNVTGTHTSAAWASATLPTTRNGISYATGYWHLQVKYFSYPAVYQVSAASPSSNDNLAIIQKSYFWNPQRTSGLVADVSELAEYGGSVNVESFTDPAFNVSSLQLVPPGVVGPNSTTSASWRVFCRIASYQGETINYAIIARIIDGMF